MMFRCKRLRRNKAIHSSASVEVPKLQTHLTDPLTLCFPLSRLLYRVSIMQTLMYHDSMLYSRNMGKNTSARSDSTEISSSAHACMKGLLKSDCKIVASNVDKAWPRDGSMAATLEARHSKVGAVVQV